MNLIIFCFALGFALYAIHLSAFFCAIVHSCPIRTYFTLLKFQLERIRAVTFSELQCVAASTITLSINIPQLLSFALLCVKCDNQFTWFIERSDARFSLPNLGKLAFLVLIRADSIHLLYPPTLSLILTLLSF